MTTARSQELVTVPTIAGVPWQLALETFADTLSSPRTRRAYVGAVSEAMTGLGVGSPAELEPPMLAGYRAALVARLDQDRPDRLSPASVALKLAAVRRFLDFCRMTGVLRLAKDVIAFVPKSPSAKVERPYQVLTQAERGRLLKVAGRHGPRDVALVLLGLGGGLRVSELVGAHLGDFYQDDAGSWWVHVQQGKGRKDREVPLSASVMVAVRGWVKASGRTLDRKADRTTYLFCTRQSPRLTPERARQVVKGLVREAGIAKPISPHSLGHTMAIETLRAGASPVVVQRLLGHSSLATTARYVDHPERQDLARWAFSPA